MNRDPASLRVPADIGAPFEGGFYGGLIRLGAVLCAVVWAPKAEGEIKAAWLDPQADVPGARSCADSMGNTRAMAEAGSALATWALDLRIAGHDDWCLPARDVLELAYRHLKPTTSATGDYFRDGDNPTSVPPGYPYALLDGSVQQTVAEAFMAGGAEAFTPGWYWSSTQCSAGYAWSQGFYNGYQDYDDKCFEALARAVRLIQLTA